MGPEHPHDSLWVEFLKTIWELAMKLKAMVLAIFFEIVLRYYKLRGWAGAEQVLSGAGFGIGKVLQEELSRIDAGASRIGSEEIVPEEIQAAAH